MSSDASNERKRDGFNTRLGFILACVGSAVGMGNLWRFPVLISKWGGMTFMIPYIIFVILIGSTGVAEEIALGRSTKSGPIGAFGKAMKYAGKNEHAGKAIGYIPVLGSLAMAIGYTCVVGWIFKYMFLAITGGIYDMGSDMNRIGGMFNATATAFGNNTWIVISCAVCFAIMGLGIAGGIEKANKFMMPLLFGMLVLLAFYVSFKPGAGAGYHYIFTVNPAGLKDPKIWIYAFGQAFFSLSVAGNGTLIYGSYLDSKEDVPFSAANVAVFDTIAAVLAAFVIIPAMATSGAELSEGGPGLMFVYLVNVMNRMPGGRVIEGVFYVCVMFAGLSSLINLYEAPVASLQEHFRANRVIGVGIIGVIGTVSAIFIQGIVSGWMDAVSIYVCPLGAFLAGVMFFWVFGRDYALRAVNAGAKHPRGDRWFAVGKYLYCALAVIALVAGAVLGGIG